MVDTPLPEPTTIVDNIPYWTEDQVRQVLAQERERIKGILDDLHKHTTLHNYYKFASLKIFGD